MDDTSSSESSSYHYSNSFLTFLCKIRFLSSMRRYESLEMICDRNEPKSMERASSTESFQNEPETKQRKRLSYGPVCIGRPVLAFALLLVSAAIISILVRRSWSLSTMSSKPGRPSLFFQKRHPGGCNEFKIIQITDIHLGEAEDLDWGPRHDRQTWKALDAVLTAEAPIDLIILGGDQLTANNCKENATAYYQELGDFLMPYGIPWALIFGNHDDTEFETNDGQKIPPKYLREDLLAIDQSFPLSLTRAGPETINGTTNYVLDIYHPYSINESVMNVAAQILLLDSGGGSIEKAITDSQVDWVREQASKSTVPAVAFQHIPTMSHTFMESGTCVGLHDDDIDPLVYDGGIMESLSDAERFFFLAVGHNHGNDYCCPYNDQRRNESALHVCFGRHSGYGGYGYWDRGCRVYQLEYDPSLLDENLQDGDIPLEESVFEKAPTVEQRDISRVNSMRWSSWVRLESGEVIDSVSY